MIRQFLSSVAVALMLCTCFIRPSAAGRKFPGSGISRASKTLASWGRSMAFRRGLWEHGYTEGKNIRIESRLLEGKTDVYPSSSANWSISKSTCIVIAGSLSAIQLAKQATKTIPDRCHYNSGSGEGEIRRKLSQSGRQYHRDHHAPARVER